MSTTVGTWESGPGATTGDGCGATVELPPATTVDGGRYRIDRVLGQGAFGITYLARDTRLGRPVAIKELFPPGCARVGRRVVPRAVDELAGARFARLRDRFVGEAESLARFSHPGIVRVHELVEEHGTAYVVMEWLPGRTLARLLAQRGGRLPVDEALAIAEQIGAALAAVHRGGVLHRDLKPDNVLVTDDGRIVLVDFGAARQFTPGASSTMTQVVTPGYAPLEQYSTRSSFGPATDVYALAATIYHLLSGRTPPPPADRLSGVEVVPLERLDRRVPAAVSAAVAHGLALEAGDRPQTVAAFLAELRGGPRGDAHRPEPVRIALDGGRRQAPAFRLAALARERVGPVAERWADGVEVVSRQARSAMAEAAKVWERSAPAAVSRPARRWRRWCRQHALPPPRAWLPLAVAVAALASVAPLHVALALVVVGLPAANAVARTRDRYRRRRWERGPRWHDRVTRPFVLGAEVGRAVAVTAGRAALPLAVVGSAATTALVGLAVVEHGVRPMPLVRVVLAAATLTFAGWLVLRLQSHPRFSHTFGRDLTGWVVAREGRLSPAGRVAWALALGLLALALTAPRPMLG